MRLPVQALIFLFASLALLSVTAEYVPSAGGDQLGNTESDHSHNAGTTRGTASPKEHHHSHHVVSHGDRRGHRKHHKHHTHHKHQRHHKHQGGTHSGPTPARSPDATNQGATAPTCGVQPKKDNGTTPAGDQKHCEPAGGMATQYWDCCKVAGAWPGHKSMNGTAYSCAKDGVTQLEDPQVTSGCQGGTAFACNNHQPFISATNPNLAYAVGARPSQLGVDSFMGACYSIQFKELPGKTLVFQAINTGRYPTDKQIDIQVPGGGVGELNTCPAQWGSPPDGWGRRYGGILMKAQCEQLPLELQPGCHWRYDWLAPLDHPDGINPTIASMCRVKCPTILTNLTGTARFDDTSFPDPPQ
ncbi:hypothetical protein CF319_g7172 [Tilletia indica]|uniref:cellulase n=1 Tax=Tilletia indica TaxID=43049 RepID=A0A177TMC8_9BASI|nr:hypothetical protein CF319_g7172 [Tilletia indica]KAE8260919.1 hypothetical protein A4X13_0g3 [Tilletia indica]